MNDGLPYFRRKFKRKGKPQWWLDMYSPEDRFPFPTLKSALYAARNHLSEDVLWVKVYTSKGVLVARYVYPQNRIVKQPLKRKASLA